MICADNIAGNNNAANAKTRASFMTSSTESAREGLSPMEFESHKL
jgi:hypothetical protein